MGGISTGSGMRRVLLACGLGVAVAATACTGSSAPKSPSSPTPAAQETGGRPAAYQPLGLVGLWRVDAPGEERGAVLRLGDDLSLWRHCGMLEGEWRADVNGLFVGQLDGGSARCFPGDRRPFPSWLSSSAGYRPLGRGWRLIDRSGTTLAVLRPGGHPVPPRDVLPSLADPPRITALLRQLLRAPRPLPHALKPATPQQVLGRWVPAPGLAGPARRQPYLQFSADGTFTGLDGCNGQGGAWTLDEHGNLVAVQGAQTLIACAGAPVGQWLAKAVHVGFAGSTLVLVGQNGRPTGRLVPG